MQCLQRLVVWRRLNNLVLIYKYIWTAITVVHLWVCVCVRQEGVVLTACEDLDVSESQELSISCGTLPPATLLIPPGSRHVLETITIQHYTFEVHLYIEGMYT